MVSTNSINIVSVFSFNPLISLQWHFSERLRHFRSGPRCLLVCSGRHISLMGLLFLLHRGLWWAAVYCWSVLGEDLHRFAIQIHLSLLLLVLICSIEWKCLWVEISMLGCCRGKLMHISLVLLLLLRLLLSCKTVEAVHLLLLLSVAVTRRSLLLCETFLLLVLLASCGGASRWSFLHSLLAEEVVLQRLRLAWRLQSLLVQRDFSDISILTS